MKQTLTVDMVLRNAKIYFGGEILEGGVAVDQGRIVQVAKEPNLPLASSRVDLRGCLVLPGLIDVHVHLRGQRQAYKEDFSTGTAAAVAGGITSVLDMPNNIPVTIDSASLNERIRTAEGSIIANVGFYSAFPYSIDETEKVVEEGAVGFKLYLNTQIGGVDIDDDKALQRAFKKACALGVPVAVHAEDKEKIETLTKKERKLGHNDIDAYIKAHPCEAEFEAVKRTIRLAQGTNAHIHFCHISCKESLEYIQRARRDRLKVSCETTPHHMFLTSKDLRQRGAMMLTDPPVRSRNIANKLWSALKNNQIDNVATDHAPHLITEKSVDSIWNIKPGIPGLETMLALLLTKVNEKKLTVKDLVRTTAERPAEIFKLPLEGFLKKGYSANITVVNMHRRAKIDASEFYSKATYSPFDGLQVRGIPVKTFVNGRLVMDEGKVIAEQKAGRIIHRTTR